MELLALTYHQRNNFEGKGGITFSFNTFLVLCSIEEFEKESCTDLRPQN
jgi:hypothetical protein